MRYQFIPYLWLSLVLVIIMLTLFLYSWKRRSVRGVRFFLLTLVLVIIWVAAQACEISATDLQVKIFWANIEYVPILLTPVTYFYLALQFTGRDQWLTKRWLTLLLLVMPIACNVLLWTNDFHGLMRQNVHLDLNGSFSVIAKTYGPLFWLFSIYNFIFSIFTLFVLMKDLRKKSKQYQAQIIAVFMGLLLPVSSVGLYITKIITSRIDITPLFIGFAGLIIFWGVFRYRLFDILPIAHSMIIHEMNTGMIIFDNDGAILEINPAACEMLNISSQQPIGLSAGNLFQAFPHLLQIYKKQISKTEEVVIRCNKNIKYYEVSLKQLTHSCNTPIGWIMQIYDITTRKIEEEKMRLMASHDVLTGLLNRVYFKNLFSEKFSHAKKVGSSMAVAYLDLDDFKQINDHYGHDAGDVFLCEVAKRLKNTLYVSDVIARYGGDEYVILFPSVGDDERLEAIRRKIFHAFEKNVEYNDISLQISASIGFSVYPRDGDSLDMLIKKADKAMYDDKEKKKTFSHISQDHSI